MSSQWGGSCAYKTDSKDLDVRLSVDGQTGHETEAERPQHFIHISNGGTYQGQRKSGRHKMVWCLVVIGCEDWLLPS